MRVGAIDDSHDDGGVGAREREVGDTMAGRAVGAVVVGLEVWVGRGRGFGGVGRGEVDIVFMRIGGGRGNMSG